MNKLLEVALEEARNDSVLSLTEAGETKWEELKKKGFVNCTAEEMCQWNVLFNMHNVDGWRKEDAALWNLLGPGRDSALGRFLVKNTDNRMSYVIKNLSTMIDSGYLLLEAKK